MASSTTSRIGFSTIAGAALAEPHEWVAARVTLDIRRDRLSTIKLLCNDEPMDLSTRVVGGCERVVADWPQANAGLYVLTLVWIDDSAPSEELRCRIPPSKLTQHEIEWLLDDVQQRLPQSLAFALSAARSFGGIELIPPGDASVEQELGLLRNAIDGGPGQAGFAALLTSIARRPQHALTAETRWIPADRARFVTGARLTDAYRLPGNVDAGERPLSLPDHRSTPSADTPENQLVLHYHDELARRLRQLARVTRSEAAQREANALLARLAAARSAAPFLNRVTAPKVPPTPERLSAVLKRPDYRGVAEGLRRVRTRALLRLDTTDADAPLDALPDLYESWLTLTAACVVLRLALDAGYALHRRALVQRLGDTFLVKTLPKGNTPLIALERREDGTKVSVFAERQYPERGRRPPKGLQSVSLLQKPDIAIEIERGDRTEVVILDAKYKLREARDGDRPVKADINAMHAYRDAIRDVHDRRVVSYAAILYPGEGESYLPGLEAIRARPDDEGALVEKLGEILRPRLAPLSAQPAV
jgi:hypothetical protein